MMTGESIDAENAEKMGMIYKVYTDSEFEIKSMELVKTISEMPTKGLGLTKELMNATFNNSLEEQLILEEQNQILSSQSEDYKEGVNAFLEKRNPKFSGK